MMCQTPIHALYKIYINIHNFTFNSKREHPTSLSPLGYRSYLRKVRLSQNLTRVRCRPGRPTTEYY